MNYLERFLHFHFHHHDALQDTIDDLNKVWNKAVSRETGWPTKDANGMKASERSTIESGTPARANVIVFGDAGAGKSSLVNLIAGQSVAKASSSAVGCTIKSTPYEIDLPNGPALKIWDTAGLNEGVNGSVTALDAIDKICELARNLEDGVSLLVLCTKGRINSNTLKNYQMFKAFCDDKVPVALVVTGLENEDRKAWWEENIGHYKNEGVEVEHHACISTLKYDNADYAREVRTMINGAYMREPWRVARKDWFATCVARLLGILFGVPSDSTKALQKGLEARGISKSEAKAVVKTRRK